MIERLLNVVRTGADTINEKHLTIRTEIEIFQRALEADDGQLAAGDMFCCNRSIVLFNDVGDAGQQSMGAAISVLGDALIGLLELRVLFTFGQVTFVCDPKSIETMEAAEELERWANVSSGLPIGLHPARVRSQQSVKDFREMIGLFGIRRERLHLSSEFRQRLTYQQMVPPLRRQGDSGVGPQALHDELQIEPALSRQYHDGLALVLETAAGELTGDPVRLGRVDLKDLGEERLAAGVVFPQQTPGFHFINRTANGFWQQTIHELLDKRFIRVLLKIEFTNPI